MKEGRREVSVAGQEPVVDVELLADPLVGRDPFGPRHLLDLEPHRFYVLEEERDDRTEADATEPLELDHPLPVLVAHPLIGAQVHDVVEVERPDPVLAHRAHETDSSPLLKRPAWDFSARASVSSHSATSSKPSSRAVLAKPGYISVYS
jgi:hypothetical protein